MKPLFWDFWITSDDGWKKPPPLQVSCSWSLQLMVAKKKRRGGRTELQNAVRDNTKSCCAGAKQSTFCDRGSWWAFGDWSRLLLHFFTRPLPNCTSARTHSSQLGRGLGELCWKKVMYLCPSIKHCSPGVFQSADLINKFHRTNGQQGPAAGRARGGLWWWGNSRMGKGGEGVRDKKAIGTRNRKEGIQS